MSTVLMPVVWEMIGPMVEPQAPDWLMMKSWRGILAFEAISLMIAELVESVAYRWFAFILSTIP